MRWILTGIAWFALASLARAQEVKLSVSTEEIYADLPFILSVSASGFQEEPTPTIDELKIDGCSVAFLGATPNVSSFIQIVNGRKTESRSVTFVFRYRVTAGAAGTYPIPALAVRQGRAQAASRAASFKAGEIAETTDMKFRVIVPDRAVWVGETFPVTLEWFLQKDVSDQAFVVPLFERDEWLEVTAPSGVDERRALAFPAGAKELRLPFERDQATLDGVGYTRFRFQALATPARAGTLEVPPARVVARLEVGVGHDRFGFPVAQTRLFKSLDQSLKIEVKPLPASGRPASFSGAVGTGYTIDVTADRTVVREGDPVTLTLLVRGDGRLEGLNLPPPNADGGLSPDLFSFPDDPPPGEPGKEGGKQFRLVVRVRSEQAKEVPPLAFSFFNPVTGAYQTVRSRPIALSVEGSGRVGATEVVTGRTTSDPTTSVGAASQPTSAPPPSADAGASLAGADLSLSSEGETLAPARTLRDVLPILMLLYAAPLLLLGWRLWRLRTGAERAHQRDCRAALRRCYEAIDAASGIPAREAGVRLAASIRDLRRVLGLESSSGDELLRRVEAAGFDPAKGSSPIPEELRREARETADRWMRAAPAGAISGATVAAIAVGLAGSLSGIAWAADGGGDASETRLRKARAAYEAAMQEASRDARVAGFARAQGLYAELADRHPECPDLQADLGNAALGAQDLGTSALAFRRALRCDPDHPRARRNLAWVRSRMPPWLPFPSSGTGLDSLIGRLGHFSLPERALGGGAMFALAVLLGVPWGRGDRVRRWMAFLPGAAWAVLMLSLVMDRTDLGEAVLIRNGVLLRSADSSGAPPVFPRPLPAGAELRAAESRGEWSRVTLPGGAAGWIPASALGFVDPGR